MRVLYWKNKMKGSGIKSRVYFHKGRGGMTEVNHKFKTLPYFGIPKMNDEEKKHISDKVRKVL